MRPGTAYPGRFVRLAAPGFVLSCGRTASVLVDRVTLLGDPAFDVAFEGHDAATEPECLRPDPDLDRLQTTPKTCWPGSPG
jgi:hypothetical protein